MKKFTLFFATVVATLMVTIFLNPTTALAAGGKNKNSVAKPDTVYVAKPCPPCPDAANAKVAAPAFGANPTAQPAQPAGDAGGAIANATAGANDSLLNALIQRVEKLEKRKFPAAVNIDGLKTEIAVAQASADNASKYADEAYKKAEGAKSFALELDTIVAQGFKQINGKLAQVAGSQKDVDLLFWITWGVILLFMVVVYFAVKSISNSLGKTSRVTDNLLRKFNEKFPEEPEQH